MKRGVAQEQYGQRNIDSLPIKNSRTNEAGIIYKTDFSANKIKLEKSGHSQQASQKSNSIASRNDTLSNVFADHQGTE